MAQHQTWRINGQVYTHAQILEMRAQGIDPRTDKVEMKFVTPGTKEGLEKVKKEEAGGNKALGESDANSEANGDGNDDKKSPDDADDNEAALSSRKEAYAKMNFFALKKLAKEKGMEITKDTKKDDVLAFLQK